MENVAVLPVPDCALRELMSLQGESGREGGREGVSEGVSEGVNESEGVSECAPAVERSGHQRTVQSRHGL